MQTHVQELFDRVRPAVVHLRMGASHGSGVIISAKGYILTAAHVVGRPGLTVVVQLPDGRVRRAQTLGIHLQHDIAMVKLDDDGPWPFVPPGPRESGPIGSWCVALGHSGGFDMERGPVLRLGRVLSRDSLLRTDCQLIGGDSGGPLIDMDGRVIGIHSRIGTHLANNLHIPISTVREHWRDLMSGTITRGQSYIGVSNNNSESTVITAVRPDSPADAAGLQVGDTVTHFSGQRVTSFNELVMLVQMRHPGERVTIRVERDGGPREFVVRIGDRTENEGPS